MSWICMFFCLFFYLWPLAHTGLTKQEKYSGIEKPTSAPDNSKAVMLTFSMQLPHILSVVVHIVTLKSQHFFRRPASNSLFQTHTWICLYRIKENYDVKILQIYPISLLLLWAMALKLELTPASASRSAIDHCTSTFQVLILGLTWGPRLCVSGTFSGMPLRTPPCKCTWNGNR